MQDGFKIQCGTCGSGSCGQMRIPDDDGDYMCGDCIRKRLIDLERQLTEAYAALAIAVELQDEIRLLLSAKGHRALADSGKQETTNAPRQ